MRISEAQPRDWTCILYTTLLVSLCARLSNAQLSNLPNLSTATQTTASSAAPTSTNVPATSSTATQSPPATSVMHLTDLPTIAGAGIPTPVVPYTASAPYMQKSKLPEGTVFICVGAILGVLGASILAWRGLVAWSLQRSVQRAALSTYHPEKTGLMGGRAASPGFYAAGGLGSALSLDHLGGKPFSRPASYMRTGGSPSAAAAATGLSKAAVASPTSLFFSPTAGINSTANNATGSHTTLLPHAQPQLGAAGNRASAFLPAGYYAASASQLSGGASLPRSQPPPRISPPDSPGLLGDSSTLDGGSSVVGNVNGAAGRDTPTTCSGWPSTASLRLDVAPQERGGIAGSRAPSAYLEDLFEHHGFGMSGRS